MTEKTDTSSPSGEHLVTIREALNLLHIGHQNERLPQEAPCPYCDRRAAGLAALTEVEQLIEDEYRRGYDEGEFAGGQADTEGATE
jgi:hypothetical protein